MHFKLTFPPATRILNPSKQQRIIDQFDNLGVKVTFDDNTNINQTIEFEWFNELFKAEDMFQLGMLFQDIAYT